MTKWAEPGDALDMSGMKQPVDHVENEQRLHSVIGKAFPSFVEGEIGKTARMSDEAAILSVVHGRRVLRAAGFDKRLSKDRQPESEMFRRKRSTRLRDATAREASNIKGEIPESCGFRFFDQSRENSA